MSRVIGYKNSFLPIIKGEVRSETLGSLVDVTMHSDISVFVFMVIWMGILGFAFLSTLANPGNSSSLVALAMMAFGYLLVLIGFKFESIQSKKFLRELFQAESVQEMGLVNRTSNSS
jgi:hypothetical protein